jgi:hypothetical protein
MGAIGVVLLVGACDVVTEVAVTGADFGGATADAHCDRRFVGDGGQPSAFCQEVSATLAASQFADDCRNAHGAAAGPGLCPRDRVIAGCKIDKKTDDGSIVRDWYYDVSELAADASAEAGTDAGSRFEPPVPTDVSAVARTCADRTRYEEGAELIMP